MVEDVIIRYGRFQVQPWRMKYIKQEELSEEEIDYIIEYRHYYLQKMHEWFSKKVLPPPEEE